MHISLVLQQSANSEPRLRRRRALWLICLASALCGTGTTPARAQQTVLASTKSPEPALENRIPTCQTDIRLSGAVYNGKHPERSFALVQFRSNAPSAVVRVGSVFGAFELVVIEPRGVLLRSSTGDCWLRLVGDPNARAQPPRAQQAQKRPKKHKKSDVAVIGRR